jgi:large subunit ribosomal protein L30
MAKVKITLVRSMIGSTQRQKRTLEALGLRKLNHSVVHEVNPQIMGMAQKLNHVLKVEEI